MPMKACASKDGDVSESPAAGHALPDRGHGEAVQRQQPHHTCLPPAAIEPPLAPCTYSNQDKCKGWPVQKAGQCKTHLPPAAMEPTLAP